MNKLKGRDYTREKVRERDNHTCQKCFKTWEKNKRRFDIHHTNGLCGKLSKAYDRLGDIKNLVTLCHSCHLKLPIARAHMRKIKVHNFS